MRQAALSRVEDPQQCPGLLSHLQVLEPRRISGVPGSHLLMVEELKDVSVSVWEQESSWITLSFVTLGKLALSEFSRITNLLLLYVASKTNTPLPCLCVCYLSQFYS